MGFQTVPVAMTWYVTSRPVLTGLWGDTMIEHLDILFDNTEVLSFNASEIIDIQIKGIERSIESVGPSEIEELYTAKYVKFTATGGEILGWHKDAPTQRLLDPQDIVALQVDGELIYVPYKGDTENKRQKVAQIGNLVTVVIR